MKHDISTYRDRENIQIGMTADHACRPDKVDDNMVILKSIQN